MRRMPIRHRIAPFPRGRCLPRDYAVLVGISPGYPPVAGRLHTCYSPVRRSPPEVSKLTPALPLDLHVLSLSLAFILSQDQTLRCCILFSFFSCLLSRCALLLSLVKSARPQEIPPNTSALSVRSPSLIVLIFVLTCLVFHSSIDGNFT